MEVEDNTNGEDNSEIDKTVKEENNEKNTVEEVKNDIEFKKPITIGKVPSINKTTKTTLHKYLQQKKILNETSSTSENDSNVSEENSAKQNEEIKTKSIPIPYSEPEWKGLAEAKYQLEELKSGVIERTIDLRKKSYFIFGRADVCDICMAHPTVSRFHAVLQYRGVESDGNDKGFYLYDLKSTHGTFLNKYRIKPNVYARVKVGHMIKIGCSTRFFILQGPPEDEEEESPLTITDLKAQRQAELDERKRKEEEERLLEEQEREKQERLLEERGISWGMGEDADEETDLSENPYAQITNEELYIDDPKKALRNWFDREGEELNFDTEKAEKGLFVTKVILPIDDGDGREIIIEMTGRSKKESQVQCSLEACRVIDKMGLLRPAKREAKKQQKRNWEENDYYDSDEDSFLDRTGDLDKKREKRMRKAGKIQDTVETYDSLMEKHKVILENLAEAERKLNQLSEEMNVPTVEESGEDLDELDAYMMTLKQKKPKKIDVKIAKDEVNRLQKEEANLRKLINIAKPANMPELILKKNVIPPVSDSTISSNPEKPKKLEKESIRKDKNIEEKNEGEQKIIEENSKDSTSKNKSRVIGPTLPPNVKLTSVKSKTNEKTKKKLSNKEKEEPDLMEDDVYSNCVWKPPPGQTGDGRTALNDKLGY
ncbi:hypothetical protein O3M35_007700 [Rhynocoris fuscipes]|uniref:FHA domain-containing protein n=1 Tax=Rhynocoris fuscipes TaxID=488301 RepID=A0AAW1DCZ6_9HEMI